MAMQFQQKHTFRHGFRYHNNTSVLSPTSVSAESYQN